MAVSAEAVGAAAQAVRDELDRRQALLAPSPAKAAARQVEGLGSITATTWQAVLDAGRRGELFTVVTTRAGTERLRAWGWTGDGDLDRAVEAVASSVGRWLLDNDEAELLGMEGFSDLLKQAAGLSRLYLSRAEAAAELGHERGHWRLVRLDGVAFLDGGTRTWRCAVPEAKPAGGCSRCGSGRVSKRGVRQLPGGREPWALCASCFCVSADRMAGLPKPTHRFIIEALAQSKRCKWCRKEAAR